MSAIYAEYHRLLELYRTERNQLTVTRLISFCQRHGIRRCAYCREIDHCTAVGLHACANHYERRRNYLWF